MGTGSSADVFLFDQFRFDLRGDDLARRTVNGDFLPVNLGWPALAGPAVQA
jgi:hypothetical protein